MPGELGPPDGITGTVRPQGAFPGRASGKDHASSYAGDIRDMGSIPGLG